VLHLMPSGILRKNTCCVIRRRLRRRSTA
jgi:hypothetical protein